MRVALTPAAEEDLAAIYAYYAARSGPAADRVLGVIFKAINGLALFPLLGRPGDVAETREHHLIRYPYRIVYYLDEANQVVEVWRVVHTARQWPPAEAE